MSSLEIDKIDNMDNKERIIFQVKYKFDRDLEENNIDKIEIAYNIIWKKMIANYH